MFASPPPCLSKNIRSTHRYENYIKSKSCAHEIFTFSDYLAKEDEATQEWFLEKYRRLDSNRKNDENKFLHVAASSGRVDAIKVLTAYGVSADASDDEGNN